MKPDSIQKLKEIKDKLKNISWAMLPAYNDLTVLINIIEEQEKEIESLRSDFRSLAGFD